MDLFQILMAIQGKDKCGRENLGANVVKTLTQHYSNTFRHVYFDNFFTGIGLLLDLLKSGLYGCGTLRSNRKGFPVDLKSVVKKGMKERGESQTHQYNNLTMSYSCIRLPFLTFPS